MTGYLPIASTSSDSTLSNIGTGWAIYNDGDTSPVSYDGSELPLTLNVNSTDGNADERYLPSGVTNLWNSTTNQFNFSELSQGDMVDVSFQIKISPTTNGQIVSINFVSGTTRQIVVFQPMGPAGTYTFPYNFSIPVYDEMVNTPPELRIIATGTGQVETDFIYARVIRRSSEPQPPVLYDAYVGFSETETPTVDEIEAADPIEGPIDLSSFLFNGSRSGNEPKHPFIAWSDPNFDANQVNEDGLVNTWSKSNSALPSGNVRVMASESTTTSDSFTVNGLVPAAQTLWTPKFNGAQYVGLEGLPGGSYDDNIRITVKAFFPADTLPGDVVLLSDGIIGKSYIQRDTSFRFSLRSAYDTGNSVGVAQIPAPPISGYFTIVAERVDGQVTISAGGLNGNGSINSTASVEDDWRRIGAHIDGVLKGMRGQIHEVSFQSLSAPAPIITHTLLATSETKPNTETVDGRPMVGFPDGDRWEMVRTK